jgi:hypothetical protein
MKTNMPFVHSIDIGLTKARKSLSTWRHRGFPGYEGDQYRIMIFVPRMTALTSSSSGAAAGEALAISIPETEAAVIRHFQKRMPYGLFVPDVDPE